jgi:hypothetical protein
MADYPQIQGRFPSWASIEISVDGFETPDFSKLDWDDSLEPGAVRGTGPFKRGRTRGEYDSTASMGMYLDAATKFMQALALKNRSIGLVEFDVLAHWSEDDGAEVHEVKVVGCRIKKRSQSNAPGTDAAVLEFDLDPMWVEVDGVVLHEPTKEA